MEIPKSLIKIFMFFDIATYRHLPTASEMVIFKEITQRPIQLTMAWLCSTQLQLRWTIAGQCSRDRRIDRVNTSLKIELFIYHG